MQGVASSTLTLRRRELALGVDLALEPRQERSSSRCGRLGGICLRMLRVGRRPSTETTLSRSSHAVRIGINASAPNRSTRESTSSSQKLSVLLSAFRTPICLPTRHNGTPERASFSVVRRSVQIDYGRKCLADTLVYWST